MNSVLLWFRQDLRLHDNPALSYAVETGAVIPIYIDDTSTTAESQLGDASKWWLHHSLSNLNQALDGKLLCFRGDAQQIIHQLVEQLDIKNVVWNRCYEPYQIQRDKALKSALNTKGVNTKSFNGHLLWEPWQVLKADKTPYKVFTPYYHKGCLNTNSPRLPIPRPKQMCFAEICHVESITPIQLYPLPEINWYQDFHLHNQPGEEGAKEKLAEFLSYPLAGYQEQRNIPSVRGTSRLSAHLHFGEISPNQVWYAAVEKLKGDISDPQLDCFLSELGWREFSYYLLFHFPELAHKNYNAKFDRFCWHDDKVALHAWQQGQTGIPIVDAGMRELWQTGYMHNRVRMIVGSFLVKNLLVDWRHGERWFWDCLLDADLASNAASWQWVAGSGADAAPYFRIFNPVLQGEKFDKSGEYVKRYCPELTNVPDKYIHQPWQASDAQLREFGVTLGATYPHPIVDLKVSRQRALDAYAVLK